MMLLRSLLLLSTGTSIVASSLSADNPFLERELTIDILDTTIPRAVADSYAFLGYDTVHNASCTLRMYNTPEDHAAGDIDLSRISSKFVIILNAAFAALPTINDEPPIKIIAAEVAEQLIGTQVLPARRKLAVRYPYNYANVHSNYICPPSMCWKDNSDKRRLDATDKRVLTSLPQTMLQALRASGSAYFSTLCCLKISCDGELTWEESAGCDDISLV